MEEPVAKEVQAPAVHGNSDSLLSAADRNQCDHVLCSGSFSTPLGSEVMLLSCRLSSPELLMLAQPVVSMYGVDKWGRRKLFLEGGTQMLICQIVVAACIGANLEWMERLKACQVGIPIEEMSRVWKQHWYWKRLLLMKITPNDGYEMSKPTIVKTV
ncbi:hypothetical protein M0R45_013094 [Rubus argutus]|uniref:Uncharacterized protein n=1 Tax=Rubus argutus TaxID=59490 RepID=A0AAW1XI13_RUBAR